MGYKSRGEQPASEMPPEQGQNRVQAYVARGLNMTEASQLVTIEEMIRRDAALSKTEKEQRNKLLAKLRPAE